MKTSEFDYHLPPELIAQTPTEPRDRSRLMVLSRCDGSIEHRRFYEIIDYIEKGDMVVFNNSRVIPARLVGQKRDSQTKVEILLLRRLDKNVWETLVRPARKLMPGAKITIAGVPQAADIEMTAEVLEQGEAGIRTIRFSNNSLLEKFGQIPLPPYISTPLVDTGRYQTIYAQTDGSVAAPTAGLHFTSRLIDELQKKGARLAFVTLHIGLDTFRPVRVEDPSKHPIHREYGELNSEVASLINQTKEQGKKVVAVGTSTVRLLEAVAETGRVQPFAGWVDLLILPGYKFRIADVMVTNFHLPRSTLLMLVSAFAGKDFILQAYEQAKSLNYRFYSFGDAMLIL
ncbi:MAG: tRNA preQ1(34) S-adenosylmethionine ribosyltransferase-isomerase QueA [Dehalococcoidia bacterium]|nr:tRNA preQ1(34) S-adenosylmethionine ribosyltransferase-isomerase QueA [Dehalococcoidia bacterium]